MWTRLARLGSTDIRNCGVVLRPNPNCFQRRYPQVAVRSLTLCSVGVNGQQQHGSSVTTEDRSAQSVETSWDTIAALSSGAGRCGVALLRVSGPRAGAQLITARNVNWDCFGRLCCVNCRSCIEKCPAIPQGVTGTQKSGTQTCSETYLLPQSASKHSECGLQVVSEIRHPSSREVLDKALLLRFPGPHSFTGEDVAELHVHGGPAVVRAVLDALCSIDGVRLAEAGEFTRRAFELGKVDLTEAEGLADLLSAETEAQRKQALRQSTGLQRQQYELWRSIMLRCLANIEAVIDFGEDEEIAEEVAQQVLPKMQALQQQLQHHLVNDRRSELVRSGLRIAIVGAPNVGKSTILNYLAGRRAAIVSAIPGTTRDAIEVTLDISGYKVIVTDTAGLRETLDPIEAEGVALAQETALQADLVLSVLDCTALADLQNRLPPLAHHLPASTATGSSPDRNTSSILVLNKVDALLPEALLQLQQQLRPMVGSSVALPSNGNNTAIVTAAAQPPIANIQRFLHPTSAQLMLQQSEATARVDVAGASEELTDVVTGASRVVLCSCKTGLNMELLTDALEGAVQEMMQQGQEAAEGFAITRARHRQHVEQCTEALERYQTHHMALELAAEELRAAAKALGRVTGIIDTEDLLDAIFSEFCIGK